MGKTKIFFTKNNSLVLKAFYNGLLAFELTANPRNFVNGDV